MYFVVNGEYDSPLQKLTSKGRLQALATAQILASWGLDPTSIRVADTGGAEQTAIFIVRYFINSFIECVKLLRDIKFNERGEVAVSELLWWKTKILKNVVDDKDSILIYMHDTESTA